MNARKHDMTTGLEWKQILLFSIPIMLGNLLQQLYNTIDGIVVGRLVDSDALAAVGNCATVAAILIAIAIGFSAGCGILISHYFGAGREDDLRSTFTTGIILMVLLSLAFTAVGILGYKWLLATAMNITSEPILAYAEQYLVVYCMGLLFTYGYNYIAYVLRAVGDSRATLYFLAISSVLNLALDVVLVKSMGITGAALATVISQCICFLFSYYYMSRHYKMFTLRKAPLRIDPDKAARCLKMGIPSIMQQCSVSLGQGAMQRLVNGFGDVTMAAYTVGSKLERYSTVPILAIQLGMSTFTGQNLGAGKPERVKRGLRQAEVMVLAIVSALCIPIAVFAPQLAGLFGVEGRILAQAVEYVRFCMPWCIWIFAAYLACAGLLQGAGDVKYTTFISLSSLAVRAVWAYVCVYSFDWDYPVIWQSLVIAYVWSLVFAVVRYFSGKWKAKSDLIMEKAAD